jgi:hypothetical protein
MEQARFKGGAFFQKIRMPYRPTRASEGGEDQHHLGQELKGTVA